MSSPAAPHPSTPGCPPGVSPFKRLSPVLGLGRPCAGETPSELAVSGGIKGWGED